MKTIISIACLVVLLVAGQKLAEASPVVVAASPVVASVVHSHPASTVVKTEQVHDGAHSSYSYSTEVRAQPVVHTHAVAAAAPAALVSTVHHTVPTYAAYGYYPANYAYYSPYHYVVGNLAGDSSTPMAPG